MSLQKPVCQGCSARNVKFGHYPLMMESQLTVFNRESMTKYNTFWKDHLHGIVLRPSWRAVTYSRRTKMGSELNQ